MILYDTMVNFCMLSLKSSFSLVENSKEPLPGALEHVTPIPTDLTDLELFRKYCMPIGDVWNEVSCSQKKKTCLLLRLIGPFLGMHFILKM